MRASSILLALLFACDADDGITVLVDLRTDLVAGDEFFAVRTEIGSVVDEQPALMGQSYLDGRRIAEIGGLAPGRAAIRVVLLDASGGLVTEQTVAIDLAADAGVTVVITRDCLGVRCPAAGEPPDREVCLGGVCVTPECAGPLAEGCPPAECSADTQCAAPPCRAGRCAHGVCLTARDDDACEPGERCDPVGGCVPVSDGGLDAGGSDGGGSFDFRVDTDSDTIAPGEAADLTLTTTGTAGLGVTVDFHVPAWTTHSADDFLCTIPAPATDVADDFNRPSAGMLGAAPTGQSWIAMFGPSPGIDANALDFRSMGYSFASIRAPGRSEGRLAVTLARPGDEAWLVAAVDGPVTYVRFGHCCGGTSYFLQNVVDGEVLEFEALQTLRPALAPSAGDRLELRIAAGGVILALVDGELLFEARHSDGDGREPVGVSGLERGGNASLDDFTWGPEPEPIACARAFVLSDAPDETLVRITLARPLPSSVVTLPFVFTAEAAGTTIERHAELRVAR